MLKPANRDVMLDELNIKGKICAEIGVFRGDYSKEIFKRQPHSLYLVDPWFHQDTGYNECCNINNETFNKYYNDLLCYYERCCNVHLMRLLSNDFATLIADESFDFIYIDANHSKDAVFDDITRFWPKVKKGGWLCGHDYRHADYPGVKESVDRFLFMNNLQLDLDSVLDVTWGIIKK